MHKEMYSQTRRKIKQDLLVSISEVGFSKVNVKQLAQAATINRQLNRIMDK